MKKQKLIITILLVTLLSLGGGLLHVPHVFADTFVVNSVLDSDDTSPGDGICDDGLGNCTLRAAIEETNALGGSNTINFNISGAGVHTITPASNFPQTTDAVTIDATTQPGTICGTLVPASLPANSNTQHTLKIQIDATNVNKGFDVGSDSVTIKGFVINNAQSEQVYLGTDNDTVECNYLGTNVAGDAAGSATSGGVQDTGNSGSVIQNNLISADNYGVSSGSAATIQNNLIGTTADGLSELHNNSTGVSANGNATIRHNVIAAGVNNGAITSYNSSGLSVKGNFIGLNLAGAALGNQGDGISMFSSNGFTIGGVTAADRNVIAASSADGIHVYSNCNGNGATNSTIFGNYIGTKADGTVSSGYGNLVGIEVNEFSSSCGSVYHHQIGGDLTGQPNTIAGNANEGVLVHQDGNHDVFSVSILSNSIFGNGTMGIDLANDSGNDGIVDTDQGPNPINDLTITYPTVLANNYLNHPTVNSAALVGDQLTVNYDFTANAVVDSDDGTSLRTTDLAGYRLDFYVNDQATDGSYSGYSQGSKHIGSFIVDGSATSASHTFTSPVTLSAGQAVTATATVLWKVSNELIGGCDQRRVGDGPPYQITGGCN